MTFEKNILGSGIFDFLTFPVLDVTTGQVEGENLQGVLLVVSGPGTDGADDFLKKVMAAVGCDSTRDAAILRVTPQQKFRFSQMAQNIEIKRAIFFGPRPVDAGLNFNAEPYQPLHFGGKTFLFADTLSKIQETPALKRPLWEGLKVVFGA